MQSTLNDPGELQRLAARAARAVAGVARIADPDLQVRVARDGTVAIECTLTANPDVQLHELGAAVQIAIAAALRRGAGVEARTINVFIMDIAERAAPELSNSPEKKFDHG